MTTPSAPPVLRVDSELLTGATIELPLAAGRYRVSGEIVAVSWGVAWRWPWLRRHVQVVVSIELLG